VKPGPPFTQPEDLSMPSVTLHNQSTREPIGVVLTTRPDYWAELDEAPWVNPAQCDTRSHRDDTDWAALFGLAE
jgi:hypothetical protein